MMRLFIAMHEPEEDGWWSARIPDVQGCLSQGRSLEESALNVEEALALCLEVDGDEGPYAVVHNFQIAGISAA